MACSDFEPIYFSNARVPREKWVHIGECSVPSSMNSTPDLLWLLSITIHLYGMFFVTALVCTTKPKNRLTLHIDGNWCKNTKQVQGSLRVNRIPFQL